LEILAKINSLEKNDDDFMQQDEEERVELNSNNLMQKYREVCAQLQKEQESKDILNQQAENDRKRIELLELRIGQFENDFLSLQASYNNMRESYSFVLSELQTIQKGGKDSLTSTHQFLEGPLLNLPPSSQSILLQQAPTIYTQTNAFLYKTAIDRTAKAKTPPVIPDNAKAWTKISQTQEAPTLGTLVSFNILRFGSW
jgi:predicted RNase H-like nuclease (RuvC/YqgF family)